MYDYNILLEYLYGKNVSLSEVRERQSNMHVKYGIMHHSRILSHASYPSFGLRHKAQILIRHLRSIRTVVRYNTVELFMIFFLSFSFSFPSAVIPIARLAVPCVSVWLHPPIPVVSLSLSTPF